MPGPIAKSFIKTFDPSFAVKDRENFKKHENSHAEVAT
jgi:hypothetical protein